MRFLFTLIMRIAKSAYQQNTDPVHAADPLEGFRSVEIQARRSDAVLEDVEG